MQPLAARKGPLRRSSKHTFVSSTPHRTGPRLRHFGAGRNTRQRCGKIAPPRHGSGLDLDRPACHYTTHAKWRTHGWSVGCLPAPRWWI